MVISGGILQIFEVKTPFLFAVPVRLGGSGSTASEGYVEALGANGEWGGVCDDKFDINDAHVICKMLGNPSALQGVNGHLLYSTAPSGNDFVLNNLGCFGTESSVFDCAHDGEWQSNCEYREIAGVKCALS